jgi:DNA-binding transcriptional MerR regulator
MRARFGVGELSRRTGVPVRTIRFYSDSGLLPPAGRSEAGYRRYDEGSRARLALIRTLRALGVELAAVRAILARERTVTEVAATHAAALDVQIQTLALHRALLRAVVARAADAEEMTQMHEHVLRTDDERRRVVTDFVEEVFADADGPVAGRMRAAMPELGQDPSAETLEAWLELSTLIADPAFRARVREMAVAGAAGAPGSPIDPGTLESAGAALARGVEPASAEGHAIVDALAADPRERAALADRIACFTDARVERYWQLLGTINGWPAVPAAAPAWEWLIAALRMRR